MPVTITAIVASTSGHTEYTVRAIQQFVKTKNITLNIIKAEQATERDIKDAEVLLLASSTWNTGGNEGQLNPHMYSFLHKVGDIDLTNKKCIVVGLGDERYRYTAKAVDRLEEFVKLADGTLVLPPFKLVNEPYGQEKLIETWSQKLVTALKK